MTSTANISETELALSRTDHGTQAPIHAPSARNVSIKTTISGDMCQTTAPIKNALLALKPCQELSQLTNTLNRTMKIAAYPAMKVSEPTTRATLTWQQVVRTKIHNMAQQFQQLQQLQQHPLDRFQLQQHLRVRLQRRQHLRVRLQLQQLLRVRLQLRQHLLDQRQLHLQGHQQVLQPMTKR